MKLHYFQFPARGECIRLLLFHAGVKFQDIKYERKVEWYKHKESFELQQVPVLEDSDGRKLPQSFAIMEYLGKKYGYLPADYEKLYDVLYIMNLSRELFDKALLAMNLKGYLDEKGKEIKMKELLEQDGPVMLSALQQRLKDNVSQEFMVGSAYTIADFVVLGFYQSILYWKDWETTFASRIQKKYPVLQAYIDRRLKDFAPFYHKCHPKLYYAAEHIRKVAVLKTLINGMMKSPAQEITVTRETYAKEKLAETIPYTLLPAFVCEECGTRLSQPDAIIHRIGARSGLLPVGNEKKLYETLWWCGTLRDLMEGVELARNSAIPEAKRNELWKEFAEKRMPVLCRAMEERLRGNKTQEFLIGRKNTVADFYFVGIWRACVLPEPDLKSEAEKFPGLSTYFAGKSKTI